VRAGQFGQSSEFAHHVAQIPTLLRTTKAPPGTRETVAHHHGEIDRFRAGGNSFFTQRAASFTRQQGKALLQSRGASTRRRCGHDKRNPGPCWARSSSGRSRHGTLARSCDRATRRAPSSQQPGTREPSLNEVASVAARRPRCRLHSSINSQRPRCRSCCRGWSPRVARSQERARVPCLLRPGRRSCQHGPGFLFVVTTTPPR